MNRKALNKTSAKKPVRVDRPNLAHHNLPEPFASLQTAGFEEQLDLYQKISSGRSPEGEPEIIDLLTDMALDETYYSYSDEDDEEDADPRCFAPLQAIRALCYFADRVARVVPRLVPLFATDDMLLREELPLLFTCIGPEAAETLTLITIDTGADIYLRDGAAESLVEMTNIYPELTEVVAEALVKALVECTDAELTAYFIVDLMDLGAVASLDYIAAAFRESRVDTDIITLNEVHDHFRELLEKVSQAPDDLKIIYDIDDENEDNDEQMPYVAPEKIGRNELCPCGSGKKYKKCCGSGT